MNVGFIAPQISLSKGGIQTVSYLLAKTMPQKISFHTFCAKDSDIIDANDSVTYCSHMQNETAFVHYELIRNVFKEHAANPFDFTMASLYSYGLACYLLKKVKKVPYGILVHGNELMEEPKRQSLFGNFIVAIKKKARIKIFKNADVIIANSEYTKALYENNFNEKNAIVINPPVNFIEHDLEMPKLHNKMILSVGRIVERKGFQNVILAMKEIVDSVPDLKYYIAGDGPYLCELKRLIDKYELNRNVILLGRVSELKKDELYKKCDFFIMPSYIIEENAEVEGFGIVYIEANMYGKYVIATKTGGIQDAVSEGITGEFVKPNDPSSLYAALKKLYFSDFAYDAEKCIEWSRKFSADSIADIYVDKIFDLLGKSI